MKRVLSSTAFLLLAGSVFAKDASSSRIEVDFNKSQALFNAIEKFKSDGYSWKDYQVVIYSKGEGVEVVFFAAIKDGDEPMMGSPPGRPEVHYLMDSKGQTVLRKSFGR